MENALTAELRKLLLQSGADLMGVGDLRSLPEDQRLGLPLGVCVAVKFPKEVIRGIGELPTPAYKQWYDSLNQKLDGLVSLGAELLESRGFRAQAQTRAQVGQYGPECLTRLPYKTVATRAGLGWIGRSCLLVTPEYGGAIRLSSLVTNAPLPVSEPVAESRCGECRICADRCPARALTGKLWQAGMAREELFQREICQQTQEDRMERATGIRADLCGMCFAVCPYTRRYLDRA